MHDNSIFGLYYRLTSEQSSKNMAIIGGGGKSSMLCAIAAGFRRNSCSVLFTTTTKMRPQEVFSIAKFQDSFLVHDYQQLSNAVDNHDTAELLFCHSGIKGDKVFGVQPSWLEQLTRERPRLPIIYEADGSRGLPLKYHQLGEPLLMKECSVVFIVGLCALGTNTRDTLHRFALRGEPGRLVDAAYLVNLAVMALDNIQVNGTKAIFLNQCELISHYESQVLHTVSCKYPLYLGSVKQDYYIKIN